MKTGRKNFTVSEDLHFRAAVAARTRRVTIESLVSQAVERELAHNSQEPPSSFEPPPGCISSAERSLWGQVQRLMADPKLAPVLRGLIALLDDDTLGQTAAPSQAAKQADRRRAPQKQKGMTPE